MTDKMETLGDCVAETSQREEAHTKDSENILCGFQESWAGGDYYNFRHFLKCCCAPLAKDSLVSSGMTSTVRMHDA